MVYGIDFGTTFTVVCYYSDDFNYIKFDNDILFPTSKSGIKNLKRKILEKFKTNNFSKEEGLLNTLINFFSYIKAKIKEQAQEETEFVNCVLTVPVRFNDWHRYFVKYAAICAGFNILKLIQEPVAAAIAAINEFNCCNGKYVIYDLGGGTFDATLINKVDEIFQIIKVDGLDNFGGTDIDKFLSSKYSISLNEAQNLKKQKFLNELNTLLQPTYDIIDKISDQEAKALILVGGSSYLRNISNQFNNKFKVLMSENLQTLVARGAALYGKDFINKSQFLIDVTPFNLGIEVLGDKLEVIIEENSPIPIKKSERFVPVNKKTSIRILQGNSLTASECNLIGSVSVSSDSPFHVDFILDCDGILTVQVLDRVIVLSDVFSA